MGLLGGFKAKLFSRNKEKPSGVVCLSYHINPDVYGTPAPIETIQAQNIGKHEVVKHRRTVTKPVVQNIFSESIPPKPDVVPKKSNLKKPKDEQVEDNRVSTLIHMTSDHDEEIKQENDYIEILSKAHSNKDTEKLETYDNAETLSLPSRDNYPSTAESLFFADSSPVVKKRPRNFHLTDYGDTLSQSSQTSA